jgi:hypothetical protein
MQKIAVSGNTLSSAVETGVGLGLGGLGGHLTEKKDKEGKRAVGLRTAGGALAGGLLGHVGGAALRHRAFFGDLEDFATTDIEKAKNNVTRKTHDYMTQDLKRRRNITPEGEARFVQRLPELQRKLETEADKFSPFGIGRRRLTDVATDEMDAAFGKEAATPLTVLTEAGAGSALGGLGGYATEKKDEKGKRSIGARTGLGALGGGVLGAFGGELSRLYKINPNQASLEILSKGDHAKFRDSLSPENRAVLDQADTGYHPFGIGLKRAPSDLGPNWKRVAPEGGGEKAASIAEYSVLFDKIDSGEFGPHVKEALFGVCEGLSSSLQSHHAKVASSPMQMTESQARQARLDQLLRKF